METTFSDRTFFLTISARENQILCRTFPVLSVFSQCDSSSKRNADSAQATKNFKSSNTPPFRGLFPKTNQQIGVFTMKQNFTNLYAKSNAM